MTTLTKLFFSFLCLCVVWSVAVQTLNSISKYNIEYNQRLKDTTETTKGSEGGRVQGSKDLLLTRCQMSKKLFWQRKSTKKL